MAKTPQSEEAADGGAPAPAEKSMLGKLLVLVLVVVVVAVECTVAYLCIPAASSTAAAASNAVKPPSDKKKGEERDEGEPNGMIEVDLKEYSVTRYQAASNSTLRVDFHLHGIVAKEDDKDFQRLFEENQAHFANKSESSSIARKSRN